MWFAPHDNVREITKEEIGVNLAQETISAEKQHVGTYPFRVLCPAHGHRPNPLDSPPLAVSYRFRIAIRSFQKLWLPPPSYCNSTSRNACLLQLQPSTPSYRNPNAERADNTTCLRSSAALTRSARYSAALMSPTTNWAVMRAPSPS